MLEDLVFHPPNYTSYLSGADSDTEGESMTSSPVLAKKHYEEEERLDSYFNFAPVKGAMQRDFDDLLLASPIMPEYYNDCESKLF